MAVNPNVPPFAAILLNFIGKTETGREGLDGYDVIYGHKQSKLPKPLTSMTLDEVQAAQVKWSKHHGSSAAGRYQFMRATLKGLIAELGLSGSQRMNPELQDAMGYHLLKRRGFLAFVNGQIGMSEFGKRLAQEWASFPVLVKTKGAHRDVEAGETYYAGDKINKALVRPYQVAAVLNDVLKLSGRTAPAPTVPVEPTKRPEPLSLLLGWLVRLLSFVFAAVLQFFKRRS